MSEGQAKWLQIWEEKHCCCLWQLWASCWGPVFCAGWFVFLMWGHIIHPNHLLFTKYTVSLGSLPAQIQNWMERIACHSPQALLDLPNCKLIKKKKNLWQDQDKRWAIPGYLPLSPALACFMLSLLAGGERSTLPPPLDLETLPPVNPSSLSQEVVVTFPELLEHLPLCIRNYLCICLSCCAMNFSTGRTGLYFSSPKSPAGSW